MLQQVKPTELSVDDLELIFLADSAGDGFHSISPQELVKFLWSGDFQLFRCPLGVLLTEVAVGGDGSKRLRLLRMAGKNLALHFEKISSDLQHVARELGCNAIEAVVYSSKLAKALTRGGAEQESITMVLEL